MWLAILAGLQVRAGEGKKLQVSWQRPTHLGHKAISRCSSMTALTLIVLAACLLRDLGLAGLVDVARGAG